MAINSLGSSGYLYSTQALYGATSNTASSAVQDATKLANQLISAVESGELSISDLEASLSERFGEEAVASVFTDEGIDTEALTELLSDALGDAEGMTASSGAMPPPPPPPPKESMDVESLAQELTNMFGEEATSTVISEDNQIDFEALATLLQSAYESTSGTIIDTSA